MKPTKSHMLHTTKALVWLHWFVLFSLPMVHKVTSWLSAPLASLLKPMGSDGCLLPSYRKSKVTVSPAVSMSENTESPSYDCTLCSCFESGIWTWVCFHFHSHAKGWPPPYLCVYSATAKCYNENQQHTQFTESRSVLFAIVNQKPIMPNTQVTDSCPKRLIGF